MNRTLLFDLESNGLLPELTTIHTMTVYDYSTDTFTRYDKEKVREGVNLLAEADVVIGHNAIAFDVPAIKKLYPWFSPKKVLDTLVWARLVYADIKDHDFRLSAKGILPKSLIGSHSLKAYGYRLGVLKGVFAENTDWQEWSPEMSAYCEQDVRVTKKLYEKLLSKNTNEEAIKLEHQVAHIIQRQVQRGFCFDEEKAQALYVKLLKRKEELTRELQQVFPPWFVPNGKVVIPKRGNKKKGVVAGCPYQKIKLTEFNPGSRTQIIHVLKKRYGWEPTEFTEKGQPKVDDDVLSALPWPEAKLLTEYLTVDKRLGQLAEGNKAWLKMVASDGRIHGDVITNGAVTGRMTHNNPNVAQVPAVRASYGKECRELFKASPGFKLVGCDASGLELRCLAHYMARYDSGEYAKTLIEGDIHTANQKAAGLPTRDNAKTFIYGFLYGAGDAKIGEIVGKGAGVGRKLKQKFLQQTPALAKLKIAVEKVAKERGYLIGLDGRHLKIRSQHAALNTLLQSAGALIMKKALVILDEDLQKEEFIPGVHYEFVANVHDEWQIEALPDHADVVGKTAQRAIRKAGECFNFRCPLDGEYSIGDNWAETH